jgi:hypothetical protein
MFNILNWQDHKEELRKVLACVWQRKDIGRKLPNRRAGHQIYEERE